MDQNTLAIAHIPKQKWNKVYDAEKALYVGTIFPDLHLPFYVTDDKENQDILSDNGPFATPQMDLTPEEAKMMELMKVSFAADDLRLFLDTHGEDTEGKSLLTDYLQKRKELLAEFARDFYPLTFECVLVDNCCGEKQTKGFCWQEGPLPWEGACV